MASEEVGSSLTFEDLATSYIQDYELQGYRTTDSARGRVANLKAVFGGRRAADITPAMIRVSGGRKFDSCGG